MYAETVVKMHLTNQIGRSNLLAKQFKTHAELLRKNSAVVSSSDVADLFTDIAALFESFGQSFQTVLEVME